METTAHGQVRRSRRASRARSRRLPARARVPRRGPDRRRPEDTHRARRPHLPRQGRGARCSRSGALARLGAPGCAAAADAADQALEPGARRRRTRLRQPAARRARSQGGRHARRPAQPRRRNLDALQKQLHDQIAAEMQQQVAPIRSRSLARYQERSRSCKRSSRSPRGRSSPRFRTASRSTVVNPNLPPDLRRRIGQLHADYTKAFQPTPARRSPTSTRLATISRKRYEVLHRDRTIRGGSRRAERDRVPAAETRRALRRDGRADRP